MKWSIRGLVVAITLSVSGVAFAAKVDLSTKSSVKAATAGDLSTAVRDAVRSARANAANAKAADAATEAVVRAVFSKLGPKDEAKAVAILVALHGIEGVNFLRVVTVAAESQPLLARAIARAAVKIDPKQSAAIVAALSSSKILNKTLGSGPGGSSFSANIAVLSGGVQSDEQ